MKTRLEKLKERADIRRNRKDLRHIPTEKELEVYSQNAKDMEFEQYKTI